MSTHTRTRTHSALKWLANERAAVAGEVQRFDRRIHHLTELRGRVAQELARIEERLRVFGGKRGASAQTLQALDDSLRRYSSDLDPSQIRAVHARGAWGPRGAMKQALLHDLAAAGRAGLYWEDFAIGLSARFGFEFDTKAEAQRWWHNIPCKALRELRTSGIVSSSGDARTGLTWHLTSVMHA